MKTNFWVKIDNNSEAMEHDVNDSALIYVALRQEQTASRTSIKKDFPP